MIRFLISAFLLLTFSVISFSHTESEYETVEISSIEWMKGNLSVTQFRNGDKIPFAKTKKDWFEAAENHEPAWCFYDDKDKNAGTYGIMYNWYAVNDQRGLAPVGFHVASISEWNQLKKSLESNDDVLIKYSDESFFLYGGYRFYGGAYDYMNQRGFWWTSDEKDGESAYFVNAIKRNEKMLIDYNHKEDGMYVKCVKD